MQFIPFNEQYDQAPVGLIPFDPGQHLEQRYSICLKIHPSNPQLSRLKGLVELYAKRLKAALKFTYSPHLESINSAQIVITKPGGGEISFKGCHNEEKVKELFQLIVS